MKENYRIAIVGVGPRGLAIFERIIAHARRHERLSLELLLFNKSAPGPGCHVAEQSPILLLNTAADQVTQFPAYAEGDQAERIQGPDFAEWLHTREIGQKNGAAGRKKQCICDTYQPRALYGAYLKNAFALLLNACPPNVAAQLFTDTVSASQRLPNGGWSLTAGDKIFPDVDFLHLATGHNMPLTGGKATNSTLPLIEQPFPIESQLAEITADMTVAIEGLGLTAFDIIAELTIGRGGRFVAQGHEDELIYIPSGREPRLLAYSRSGLPLSARPVNQKGLEGAPQHRHFTAQVAARLQAAAPVNFQSDILPLLIRDMEEAYYTAMMRAGELPPMGRSAEDWVERAIEATPPHKRFCWDKLQQVIPPDALQTPAAFAVFLEQHLRADLREANRGNLHSPLKAACDVLRDLRERMALVIDFKGLTGESQRWLYHEFLPLLKLLSVGPPKERIAQFLALMAAGVLQADFGPGSRCEATPDGWLVRSGVWDEHTAPADLLIWARIPAAGPISDSSLIGGLLADGWARRFRNGDFTCGGLEVTRTMNVVAADGSAVPNLWATGVVTEGSRFYTFVLPRPGAPSRFEADAETAVQSMFAAIDCAAESVKLAELMAV